MTKWNLPEGRKPLTDADIADLTRRLADTAIEQSELYQAAKRDAEEAEAYAAELEAKLQDMALDCLAAQGQAAEAYQAQLVAEAEIDRLRQLIPRPEQTEDELVWRDHMRGVPLSALAKEFGVTKERMKHRLKRIAENRLHLTGDRGASG
jgi:hypothetical protein